MSLVLFLEFNTWEGTNLSQPLDERPAFSRYSMYRCTWTLSNALFELHCISPGLEKPYKQEAELTHCSETLMTLESSPSPPHFYPWRLSQGLWQQALTPSPLTRPVLSVTVFTAGFPAVCHCLTPRKSIGNIPALESGLLNPGGSNKKKISASLAPPSFFLLLPPPSLTSFVSIAWKAEAITEKGKTI